MKQNLPLKRFEYCIPAHDTTPDGMKIQDSPVFGLDFQQTALSIDFENRKLLLFGDGINIRATIYPGFNGALAGLSTDELVFSLEGLMEHGKIINSFSGLLVLDNMPDGHGTEVREWHAILYLYDDHIDGREIKLRLTFDENKFQKAVLSVKTMCMNALPEARHFYDSL